MSVPIHVTDESFEQSVLKSETPVIVDFWAPWCGPCRQIAPILEKIATDYDGKLIVAKVNTDEHPQWAQHFEVRGIPTMLFVAGGRVVYQQVGSVPHGYLTQVVDKFLDVVSQPAPAAESAETAETAEQAAPEAASAD